MRSTRAVHYHYVGSANMGVAPKLMAVTAPLFEIDDLSVSAADRTDEDWR